MMFENFQLSFAATRRIRLFAALVVAVVAVVVIWRLIDVLLPFLLSGAVAYLLMPLVNASERRTPWGRRWPQQTRMAISGLLLGLVILVVLLIVAVGLLRVIDRSTALVERAPNIFADVQVIYQQAVAEYESRTPANIRELLYPRLIELREALVEALNAATLRALRILQSGVGLVVSLVTVPIILFYLLYAPGSIGRGVRSLLPHSIRDDLSEIARLAGQSIGTYLRVQLLLALMTAVVIGLSLWALGVPGAPALAMLAFAAELVPIVGPTISLAVAALVTLLTDYTKTPIVIALYLIWQALQNTFLAPRLQGQALGLHPLVVILAIAIFGLYAGFFGVLVAVPLTAAGYQVMQYVVREWHAAGTGAAAERAAAAGEAE